MKIRAILVIVVLLPLAFTGCGDDDKAVCSIDWNTQPVWDLDTLAIAQEVAVNGIWGVSQNEVYAVGMVDSGQGPIGVVWKYDGTDWSDFYTRPNADLRDIHGVSSHSLWIAGIDDPDYYPGDALVLHWNGSAWEESLLDPSIPGLLAIWTGDGHFVYTGGRDGVVLHLDGVSWTQEEVAVFSDSNTALGNVWDVWGVSHDQEWNIYVGSEAGSWPIGVVIAKQGQAPWSLDLMSSFGRGGACVGVWARSADDVYALESSSMGPVSIGNLYHYTGSEWHLTDLRYAPGIFKAIRGDWEGPAFAIGRSTYRIDGNSWAVYDSFPNQGSYFLNDIWPGGNGFFVAGSYDSFGGILRADPNSCSAREH